MRLQYFIHLFVLSLLVGFSQQSWADDFSNDYARLWQLKQLFNPSDRQIKMERHQKIFTYIGLTDKQINLAMDENFDRIESFMIANVIVTDEEGNPKRNAKTGEIITEDDGC